eukprot:3418308-Prymnesium_polylepis.1
MPDHRPPAARPAAAPRCARSGRGRPRPPRDPRPRRAERCRCRSCSRADTTARPYREDASAQFESRRACTALSCKSMRACSADTERSCARQSSHASDDPMAAPSSLT